MLDESAGRVLAELAPDALVLDVGGWGSPFARADWVLDLLPYETRGLYGYDREAADERFVADTWVTRDICDHEPWPFDDDQFDFAICSHTLEDVRDPLWVCHELSRVAKAGYIETPSRLEEQTWGIHGPWVGWSHHRWLVDTADGRLRFVHKPAVLHHRDHLPYELGASLPAGARVLTYWWEGSFDAEEAHFFEADELHPYLRGLPGSPTLVSPNPQGAASATALRRRLARVAGLARRLRGTAAPT